MQQEVPGEALAHRSVGELKAENSHLRRVLAEAKPDVEMCGAPRSAWWQPKPAKGCWFIPIAGRLGMRVGFTGRWQPIWTSRARLDVIDGWYNHQRLHSANSLLAARLAA